jgi:MRG-binding protein
MADDDKINWNVDLEVSLFHAIHAHRPVGINRHFQMVFLHDKLNSATDRKISAKEIWNHLMEMYDLIALNDSDGLPFPNKEMEFALPKTLTDELAERPFPRCPLADEMKAHELAKRRDSTKDTAPAVVASTETLPNKRVAEDKVLPTTPQPPAGKDGSMSGDASVDRQHEAKSTTGVDSPRVDNRKRTRQSLHSTHVENTPPATTGTPTSSSAKRSRRN